MYSRFHVLAESPRFILAGDQEYAVIIERATGRETIAGDHYGNPLCGLIAPDESWFATGGDGLQVFMFDAGRTDLLRVPRLDIFAMRLESPQTIRVLVDPWSDAASVWIVNPLTGDARKLHDGPDLRDQPYQDDVEY